MRFLPFLAAIILLAATHTFTAGCANIVPPSGGPRDSLPPRLVSASHPDSTRNFRDRVLTFTFDEYVDLKEVQNNLLFTPTFATNPEVSVRLRTVTVKLRDSLLANTTYTFNFGNAIRDINEDNAIRDFVYTFSTGPTLDSLTLEGNVMMAENAGIDSTLQVILHRSPDDSAVARERPLYVTRLRPDGSFRFRNLPGGRFYIYALGGGGTQRRYLNPRTQDFAFLDSSVVPGSTEAITLYAYKEPTPTAAVATPSRSPDRKATSSADNRLRISTTLTGATLDRLRPLEIVSETSLQRYDSAALLLYRDSTYTPVAATLSLDSTRRRLRIAAPWADGARYHLVLQRDFAEDSAGRKLLKADTLDFSVRPQVAYARLSLRFRNLDTALHPVLVLLQNDKSVATYSLATGRVQVPLIEPGEYGLRILYDRNRNGVWDAGKFFGGNKRQPERVKPLERKLNLKAGVLTELELEG